MNRPFHRLDSAGVTLRDMGGLQCLRIQPECLERLAAAAFHDLSYYLRPDFLDELAAIADDPATCANERFVCGSLIRNAMIAAEGVLPLCQDTGTATIFAWRGERILSGGEDEAALIRGVARAWAENPLRDSQVAARSMFDERNTEDNLPAQVDIRFAPGREYHFVFIAKGGGSANKTLFHQGTKGLLNDEALAAFLTEKIGQLGVAACPPCFLSVVVGGTSPEDNLRTLKLASTGWFDGLPAFGDGRGGAFRDPEWEARVMKMAAASGWGAQFGGRHLALQARVIRLPRHAASCPVSMGVSCNAHRNMLGKITADGIFLETLDRDPSRLTNRLPPGAAATATVDLDRPMPEILRQLSGLAAGVRVALNGPMIVARDMAHARFREMLERGDPLPDYLMRHPVCYAGPARTPDGRVIGSFGPTTAQRMDEYLEELMSRGAARVTLAKGNRSEEAARACVTHGGFYLGVIGGAAALIAKEHIVASEVIDFAELGMEAVRRIRVREMPAFIVYDNRGGRL